MLKTAKNIFRIQIFRSYCSDYCLYKWIYTHRIFTKLCSVFQQFKNISEVSGEEACGVVDIPSYSICVQCRTLEFFHIVPIWSSLCGIVISTNEEKISLMGGSSQWTFPCLNLHCYPYPIPEKYIFSDCPVWTWCLVQKLSHKWVRQIQSVTSIKNVC